MTVAEYAALRASKDKADMRRVAAVKKESGYFIGGEFGGKKKASFCQFMSLATLDLDELTPEMATQIEPSIRKLGAHAVIYSTASHTPAKPRMRAVIFLAQNVAPRDYHAVAWLADALPFGAVSSESYRATQIMYLPMRCIDGEEIFVEIPGTPLDVMPIIAAARAMPQPDRERATKVTPAWLKPGIVGAVARIFEDDFDRAVHELALPYDRAPEGATCAVGEQRYMHHGASGADGATWYPNDGYLWSWHGKSDPCSEQNCSIFDVVRLHNREWTELDKSAQTSTPVHELPSHKACER